MVRIRKAPLLPTKAACTACIVNLTVLRIFDLLFLVMRKRTPASPESTAGLKVGFLRAHFQTRFLSGDVHRRGNNLRLSPDACEAIQVWCPIRRIYPVRSGMPTTLVLKREPGIAPISRVNPDYPDGDGCTF